MSRKVVLSQSAAAVALSPIKVLLVEEDPNDLGAYASSLEHYGYEVRACSRYSDCIRALECERFDFIVVGQGGPAFEGRLVLECARGLNRPAPILVVTRCPDMKCYLEAMELGALDYVEKPHSPAQFGRLVETYLRPDPGSGPRQEN
ncbi:MAG: response regulator [Terriglobia bacterium]